jgi:hypothetical protein
MNTDPKPCWKYDPGCLQIADPGSGFFCIPDPGSRDQKSTRIPNQQHAMVNLFRFRITCPYPVQEYTVGSCRKFLTSSFSRHGYTSFYTHEHKQNILKSQIRMFPSRIPGPWKKRHRIPDPDPHQKI